MKGVAAPTAAILYGQLGLIALGRGDLDNAVSWLDRGIAGVGDDPEHRSTMYMNRSVAMMQARRFSEAREDLIRSASDYERVHDTLKQAMALHNFGYAALLEGQLVLANESMTRARASLASSPVNAAICDVDRAEVLRDAGLATEAERILARTANVFGAHRMPQSRAEAEFNLARSLLTHDPMGARGAASSAARTFRRLGNQSWAARSDAVRMRAELSGGAYTRSGEHFADVRKVPEESDVEAAAAVLDRRGFRSEAAALRMSRELWRARHRSLDDGRSRVVRPPASASMEVRLLAHAVRAERAEARRDGGDARRHASRGLDMLSRWQQDFGSLDLQTSVAMHGDALVSVGLRSAVASGRPEVIFEWSERARHLMLQVVPLRPPPDPTLAAELAELRTLRREGDSDWLASPRAAELQERARERQWSATRSAAFEGRATLAELTDALDADTAVISYVYSGRELIALVTTAQQSTIVPIDEWADVRHAMPGLRADLDMSASIRVGPMGRVVKQSLEERVGALSAALLNGPVDRAGVRRLVIAAPGILNGMPWSMLPGMHGRTFTLAASASRWVRQRMALRGDYHTPSSTDPGVAPTVASRPQRSGFAIGPRVARGTEETQLASAAWPSPAVLQHPSVDDVAELATKVDVLHIAAHGRHAVDNPMFSGLELADGALFGYDIDRIEPVPSTVILSACEAGRSSVRWGEEAVGMTRIWLHAGTRCVIAAPVVVADDDACELLAAVHQGLAAGLMPSEALAAASRDTGVVAPFQAHGAGL